MFLNIRNLFLLIILSAFLCSFVQSKNDDKTYKCDLKERPDLDKCFKQPNEQTCGYYKKDCPFEVCGFPAYNGCAACSYNRVLYYTKGECKDEEVVQKCSPHICQPELFPEELKSYEPVCGLSEAGHKETKKTFDNFCKACQDPKYHWYQTGACEEDKHYCEDKRPKVCTEQYDPVCAHFSTFDVESGYTTAGNSCEACSDPTVDYYTVGKCGTLKDDATYCLPNHRPEACTFEYDPVCGHFYDDQGLLDYKVLSNSCVACSDQDILYYTPGPCVFKCDRNPNVIYDCIGSLEPVCGEYKENGKTYKVSLRNNCIGCYYSGKPIETYTDGLCPGDKGIYCENDNPVFQEGILRPVCGFYEEKCKEDSCRNTFAEPALACKDPKTVLYQADNCREDRGVSCESYRKRKYEDDVFLYENVCGYTAFYSKDYDNHYEACDNHSVLYFREGPCK